MKRREFLRGVAGASAITVADWLGYFRVAGIPGTSKDLGIARAGAAATADPHYLIYWFQDGGWDGYSMFNPVDTRNDALLVIPDGELLPNPSWSDQLYRPRGYGAAPNGPPTTRGNITSGFLADGGASLFPDLAVVSSHRGNAFHSGGRWDYHYGKYSHSLTGVRGARERTVMQAFCEAYGADHLLPHVSWHRWLADGELALANFPEGTGYAERLGPPHAHTIYGKTPSDMRDRLRQITSLTANARDDRIRSFVGDLHASFLRDKNAESTRAFAAAVEIHRARVGGGLGLDPGTFFTDPTLRSEFGIRPEDEIATSTSICSNPARSKGSPNTNVQAMMTYELMTKGLSIGFFIESRQIRGFDSHFSRRSAFSNQGQLNQTAMMNENLWVPLKVLVDKLKNTPHGTSGRSYWDFTNIVITSEMGRLMGADAAPLLATTDPDATKYAQVMDQDVCQHWHVSSAAFLGGNVAGDRQWGRVGSVTQEPIPILPSGSLDPAYDPVTGVLRDGMTADSRSFVTDAGHIYATALHLSGLDSDALRNAGKGRNTSPALRFIKR